MFERLELFLAIAKHNNVSKAADDLNSNQSTVSSQLKVLEGKLGILLFDRVGRNIRLNKNGELFREFAEKVLVDYEDISREMRGDDVGGESLAIAAGAYFHAFFLPQILPAFRKDNPLVEVNTVTRYSDDLIRNMENKEYEFAILATSHPIRSPKLHTDFSYEMPMLFVYSPDNPLSEKRTLSPADLDAETIILPLKGQNLYNYLAHNFKKHRIAFAAELIIDTADAMKSAVAQDLGVAFLPQHVVQQDIAEGKLAGASIASLELKRKLVCIHHIERPLSYAAQDFIDHAIAVIDRYDNYVRSGSTEKNQESD